jgi:hypothetical protein
MNCYKNSSDISLDERTCTIYFSSKLRTDAILELQIEDFDSENSTIPKSSTTLQFSTMILPNSCPPVGQNHPESVCANYPIFTDEVPPADSCYPVPANIEYKSIIEAKSNSYNISRININPFDGFTFDNSKLIYNRLKQSWFYNYTIRLNFTEVKQEKLSIEAIDTNGLPSPQHTYSYLLNYEPPRIVEILNREDVCIRSPTDNSPFIQLMFAANRIIEKPLSSSSSFNGTRRILFKHKETEYTVLAIETVNLNTSVWSDLNNHTRFNLSLSKSSFKPNTNYSILFEYGAFETRDFCRAQTDKMLDWERFNLRLIDDSSTQFDFDTRPNQIFNELGSIKWKLINGVTQNCVIRGTGDFFVSFACVNTTAFDLKALNESGTYTIAVSYLTVCQQLSVWSRSLGFRLIVERPKLEYKIINGYTGQYASNNFSLTINCLFPIDCDIYCRLSQNIYANHSTVATMITSVMNGPFRICARNKGTYSLASQLENDRAYKFEMYVNETVNGISQAHVIEFIADLQPPEFVIKPTNLKVDCGYDLNQLTPPKATDNFDPSPTVTYIDSFVNSCQMLRNWLAVDHLNNTNRHTQVIQYQSQSKIVYNNRIQIPCITNKQVLADLNFYQGFISLDDNKCNSTLKSTYTINKPFSLPTLDCDFKMEIQWRITDDCSNLYGQVIQEVAVLPRQLPYSPLHEQQQVELASFFRWSVLRQAKLHDLMLRKSTEEKSKLIVRTSDSSTQYKLTYNLNQNSTYYWHVIYYNASIGQLAMSPSFEFSTRSLADLKLVDVQTPISVLPGESILLKWRVQNGGNVTTNVNTWYDSLYGGYTSDPSAATYIGRQQQRRFLEPGGEYSASIAFTLDERYKYNVYYIFVFVDREKLVEESELNNNQLTAPKQVQVRPLPLPNLKPNILSSSNIVKAGKPIEFKATVGNIGEANVRPGNRWIDTLELFIVDEKLNFKRFYRTSLSVSQANKVGESYSLIYAFDLPQNYFGNASAQLIVNENNALYEQTTDDNSLITFFTILPPDTADLSVLKFSVMGSNEINTGQELTVTYEVENAGLAGLTLDKSWIDEIRVTNQSNKQMVALSKQLIIAGMTV